MRGRADVHGDPRRRRRPAAGGRRPCSVHDVEATLEYARRLAARPRELSDELCVAMRVYFEKPRTTTGWKGLINDPHLDGSGDVNAGLRMARGCCSRCSRWACRSAASSSTRSRPQYISDAVAWGAIGARTTESQIHRQLGSGLSMPVGFKNRTDGNVQVAVDAVRAAAAPTRSPGSTSTARRRSSTRAATPTATSSCEAAATGPTTTPSPWPTALEPCCAPPGCPSGVMIDVSHDNSGKDPSRQPAVAADVGRQIAAGNGAIVGVMLESFLVAGRQDLGPARALTYGQSITDGCIDWDTTVEVLERLGRRAVDAPGARRSVSRCGSRSSASG